MKKTYSPCEICKGSRYIENTICFPCEGTGDQRVVEAKRKKAGRYQASEKKDRITRRIKFFLAFVGLIVVGIGLWVQVINEWSNHPIIVTIAWGYTFVIVLLAFYSVLRSVKGD